MKKKQSSGQLLLARSKIGGMRAKRFMCALCSALLAAVSWMGTAHTAVGGIPPSSVVTVTGLNSDAIPVIRLFGLFDPDGCWLEATNW
jgi:hypothetical protein